MLGASNMFGVVVAAILLSTLTDLARGLYVPHPELRRAIVHKKVIATWDEAKLRCEKEGAMLASPVDSGLLEYMKSSISVKNHTTPYFIGMRLIDNPEHTVIVSVEGIPLDDLPQATLDIIEQIDPRDGDCLILNGHEIRTGSCLNQLPYICYKNTTIGTTTTSRTTSVPAVTTEVTTAVTTTETAVECTSGEYTKLSTGYYKLHSYNDWDQANSTCISEGGYLVVLNNKEEAQVVTDFAFDALDDTWVLIGLIVESDDWHSVRGEPMDQIYNEWADTHTNNEYTRGALKRDGLLDDMARGFPYPFVCEKSCPN